MTITQAAVLIHLAYSHSPMKLVKWRDVERTEELVYHFLKELSADAISDLVRNI